MTNLENNLHDFHVLLRARNRAMLLSTFEEGRVETDIISMAAKMENVNVYAYSVTSGLTKKEYVVHRGKPSIEEKDPQMMTPNKLIDYIDGISKTPTDNKNDTSIFLIKDIHDLWSNPSVKRRIRDLLESPRKSKDNNGRFFPYTPLVFISPLVEIPLELERLVQIVDYKVPTREEVSNHLKGMENALEERNIPTGLKDEREREAAVNALVGMTHVEIDNVLLKTTTENGKIDINDIIKEKSQIIKKTGILEYITNLGDMSNVGGLDNLKEWLDDARYSFDHEATEYGVDTTRGLIITGFPGTGKTLTAKSIAYTWNLPLLKMNMND